MNNENAVATVEDWINAWNSRDLDAILSHYAEDVVFEAQTVAKRWDKADGKLYGRDQLRKHFELGCNSRHRYTSRLSKSSWLLPDIPSCTPARTETG